MHYYLTYLCHCLSTKKAAMTCGSSDLTLTGVVNLTSGVTVTSVVTLTSDVTLATVEIVMSLEIGMSDMTLLSGV